MIYILSNIFFGHHKFSKYQIEYFENYFIPFIKKNTPEKIIITGNLFYNTTTITFSLLNKVKNLMSIITSITPVDIVDNEYCFDILSDCRRCNDVLDISETFYTFQITKDIQEPIGFYAIKNGNKKFIPNKFSPRFIEYTIKEIEDIDKIEITQDFIDLIIDSELIEKPEYKNRIEIYLNNNTFNNVFYTENKKEIEKVVIKNNEIRNILIDNIEKELIDELKEIFIIYDEKNN